MASFCAACGAQLTPEARFCASCGAAAVARCVSCEEELPVGASFCPACGSAQGETAAQPLGTNEELRIVTALFADLAGFTSHTEQADPEDVRARLSVYHRRVREDVERHGGTVEKLMGDGVFAVFGVPTVHEDDPERAVRAALRIQASVDEMNAADRTLDLSVRIGITTGEAIVQLDDDAADERIIGDAVNTASRLEGVAEPGTVVIDERTFLAVRTAVECTPLEPVTVKGKTEPIPIWRAAAARSRYGVAVEEGEAAAFVGREAERRLLVDAFDRAIEQRKPQLVTVSGEPGVGKSRLVREFFAEIDDRPHLIRWRQGRNLPYGEGVTFWALSEIVKSEAGILESEPPERAAEKLHSSVAALTEGVAGVDADWMRTRLSPLAGTGTAAGAERGELFSAWLQFFELMAAQNPMVVVIEDLHWADDALADFLEHLLDWAQDAPIMLLCTARPEWFERRPDWGGGQRQAINVGLAPLTEDETAHLVTALSARAVMPADAQAALMARSGGNPLYVTEYVRLALEEGWFEGGVTTGDLPLPDTVQSIIAARLDLLDSVDKAVIHGAAVVGKVFWSGAVAFIGDADEPTVSESLRRLSRRELIHPVRRASMEGQDEYAFAHVLARDVAYGQLPRGEKARLHRETARWLEAVSAGRLVDVAEMLAHHHLTALDLEPSDDTALRGRVYRFLMLAGERNVSLDLGRAASFYEQAAEMSTSMVARAQALLARGRVPWGERGRGLELFERTIAAFEQLGDARGLADALNQRAGFLWYIGEKTQSDIDMAAAVELVEGLEPSTTVAEVLVSSAIFLQLAGREEEALDVVERGMAVAQAVGDTSSYSRALRARGSALTQLGELGGIDDVREALRIDLDRGNTAEVLSGYNNIATFLGVQGQVSEAIQMIDAGIAYAEQRGHPAGAEWSKMTKCESLVQIGAVDTVESLSRELIAADEARGGSQVGVFAQGFTAWVHWARGDAALAWRTLSGVLEEVYRINDPQVIVPNLALAVEFARAAGTIRSAEHYADDYVRAARDNPGFLVGSLNRATPGLLELGRAADVVSILEVANATEGWPAAAFDAVRALVHEHHGEVETALELLEGAIGEADRLGLIFEATKCRIDAARCALAAGQVDRGEQLATEARAAAQEIGAGLFLDELDQPTDRGTEQAAGA